MDFDGLFKKWAWKPIRNCPGRFILDCAGPDLSMDDVLGEKTEPVEYRTPAAKDAVLVVRFSRGGLITYRRADGSFVHTLNSEEGLRRKLAQLGIE